MHAKLVTRPSNLSRYSSLSYPSFVFSSSSSFYLLPSSKNFSTHLFRIRQSNLIERWTKYSSSVASLSSSPSIVPSSPNFSTWNKLKQAYCAPSHGPFGKFFRYTNPYRKSNPYPVTPTTTSSSSSTILQGNPTAPSTGSSGSSTGGGSTQRASFNPFFIGLALSTVLAENLRTYSPTWNRKITMEECGKSCEDLLRSIVKTPFATYWRNGLYTIEMEPPYPNAPKLLLLHGYGSGSGMWLFNIDYFTKYYHVYAVDWRGSGASERIPFSATTVTDGENWFLSSLHKWMNESRIKKAIFVGHSLGGYLSSAYALHYPHHVEKLVLVSPAGIPYPPNPDVLEKKRNNWIIGLLKYSWEAGITPQALVRSLGPYGETWATNIISRRFSHMMETHHFGEKMNKDAFIRYLYQITAAEGSGERALNVLLSFGAHAREPMGPRLIRAAQEGEYPDESDNDDDENQRLSYNKKDRISSSLRHKLRIPVHFLYGQYDWMSSDAGYTTAKALRSNGINASVDIIPSSGHHLYLEQPDVFSNTVLQRLRR